MIIKEWLDNLAERDRRIVMIGGPIIAVLLVYLLIWSPLSNAVSNVNEQIQSQKSLLAFMANASQQVQRLKALGVGAAKISEEAMLSQVESSLTMRHLSSYLQKVQQPKTNEVALTFEGVPFDQLMHWLNSIWQSSGIGVKKLTAKRSDVTGTADVTMTLIKRGG